ncbi:Ger(x)C family spore germination protein [Geobacillus thermodenitrificans]|jgi:spore germination protein KC|uniref:Spore germination protein GerKC n=1 Tax=Geobacillus thermodenitrificans (strain NG80-2) TaxID=420246 RepID=A4IND8_GEOTN|nr:Ger(x)C family spore germination protein [Geobacillus thermodenitrificans]ABO66842.1 Spore germination protein GerKC [Geobacillus thermodenitrificans NG80-2]MED3906109.1 Ger(x)C family spore germination protein [Geobacillus thermodenitrificans]
MKRAFALFISLTAYVCLLAGCWSQRELTDLAFVIAIGLDKTEEGEYLASLQVVNPGNVAGAMPSGGGAGGVPVSIYTSTGDSVSEASRKATEKVSRLLYYAHTNLVVVSEELAREGLDEVFDVMERHHQFRTTAKLVIARGHSAKEVLSVLTPIDKISARQIIQMLKFSELAWGETSNIDIWRTVRDIAVSQRNPVMTGVAIEGDPRKGKRQENVQSSVPDARIKLDGLALFKNDRLVRWVDGPTARGMMWVLERIQHTNLTVPWEGKKEAIGYRTTRSKTKVKAKIKNGRPSISIHIIAEGELSESRIPINLANTSLLFRLEKELERSAKEDVTKAIKAAQREKTDVFGFGAAVHRAAPRLWKKIEKEWHDRYFPELDVTVTTDMHIRRTRMWDKPY